jgi:hypothetical protein
MQIHPLFILTIPFVLVLIGLLMNSRGVPFDHPTPSPEQDPIKRIVAERDSYLQFIDLQRTRAIKRQQTINHYAWFLIIVIAGCFLWQYEETVSRTTMNTRIGSVQTLATEDGTDIVLSVTLQNGANSKYLIRPAKSYQITRNGPEEIASNKVSRWELSKTATAVSTGGASVPLGLMLEISDQKRL